MIPVGTEISHIEIGVVDASQSRVFLEQMFGWEFHPFGEGGGGWFQTSTVKAGLHGSDPGWGFVPFFGVPDLQAAIADVTRLGGTAETPTEEPGFGRFCVCRDPQGLRFGLHQR